MAIGAGGALQWSEGDGEQRRHPEDEPTQVQQGGGHGRPHLPQRGVRPPEPEGEILLQPDLRKQHTLSHTRHSTSVAGAFKGAFVDFMALWGGVTVAGDQ